MTHTLKAALLAVTALTSVPAMAQEVPGGARPADNDVIIVTARKTEETLQEAPTTVSVVTAASIDRLGLDNLTDVAKTVPGLVFDDTFGRDANRPVIRGQANILGQSGVAFFIDGIYYSGSLADYDVDTVERFEVVKGPQSALYGRNTYSGAINLISKAPGDTWTGRVQVDLAEDDRYEATANVRGPLADGLGIALGGRILDNAGAFRNAPDAEAQRARLAMLGITGEVSEREQNGRTVYRVRVGPFAQKALADLTLEQLEVSGVEAALVRVQR